MNWEYGGAYRRHPVEGIVELPPDRSLVQAWDWTQAPLPEFMTEADTVFVDPPWNLGNARAFYTKAQRPCPIERYQTLLELLWQRLEQIGPDTLFLEMGKEYLGEYLLAAKQRYPYVTFYNATYYQRPQQRCYVIHATRDARRRRYAELEGQDEAAIIAWICRHHSYRVIADPCMGRGLVGWHAYRSGRRFVGTELNPKRLAVLVERIRRDQARSKTKQEQP